MDFVETASHSIEHKLVGNKRHVKLHRRTSFIMWKQCSKLTPECPEFQYILSINNEHYAFWLPTCLLRLLMECKTKPSYLPCCLRLGGCKRLLSFILLPRFIISGSERIQMSTWIRSNMLTLNGQNMHYVRFEVSTVVNTTWISANARRLRNQYAF